VTQQLAESELVRQPRSAAAGLSLEPHSVDRLVPAHHPGLCTRALLSVGMDAAARGAHHQGAQLEWRVTVPEGASVTVEHEAGAAARVWAGLVARVAMVRTWVVGFAKKVWKIGADDPRKVMHGLKVGLELVLVSMFYYTRPLYDGVGGAAMWAIMTVVVVFEYTVSKTQYQNSLLRLSLKGKKYPSEITTYRALSTATACMHARVFYEFADLQRWRSRARRALGGTDRRRHARVRVLRGGPEQLRRRRAASARAREAHPPRRVHEGRGGVRARAEGGVVLRDRDDVLLPDAGLRRGGHELGRARAARRRAVAPVHAGREDVAYGHDASLHRGVAAGRDIREGRGRSGRAVETLATLAKFKEADQDDDDKKGESTEMTKVHPLNEPDAEDASSVNQSTTKA
jgi:hypothetical protein